MYYFKLCSRLMIVLLIHLAVFNSCSTSDHIGTSKQYIYSFEAESIGYSDIKKMYNTDSSAKRNFFFESGSLQTMQIDLKCDIKKTMIQKNSEGALVCYELVHPSLLIANGGSQVNTNDLGSEIGHPVFVQMDAKGTVSNVKTDTTISGIATGLIKEIISELQFVGPEEKHGAWQTVEENTTGTYNANYELKTCDSSGSVYKKTILDYIKLKSPGPGQKTTTDYNSFFLVDKGTIKKINISQVQLVKLNNDTVSAVGSKITVALKLDSSVTNKDIEEIKQLALTPAYQHNSNLGSPVSEQQITKMAYQGTLGNDTWETLLQKPALLNIPNGEDEDSLVLKFRALFYLFPQNLDKVAALIANEPEGTVKFKILSKALSITESEIATDAIAAILEKRKNEEGIMAVFLPALSTTDFPTKRSVEIIKQLAFGRDSTAQDFISSTAQLALGGMANHFQKKDSLAAAELTGYLIDKMANESDTTQQILVLGNTGSPAVIPIFRALIDNKNISEDIKLKAVGALRNINDNEVTTLLQQLAKNKDTLILKATVDVLQIKKTIN